MVHFWGRELSEREGVTVAVRARRRRGWRRNQVGWSSRAVCRTSSRRARQQPPSIIHSLTQPAQLPAGHTSQQRAAMTSIDRR